MSNYSCSTCVNNDICAYSKIKEKTEEVAKDFEKEHPFGENCSDLFSIVVQCSKYISADKFLAFSLES